MTQLAFIIAGSEATGGAGIQADLRTYQQLGVYGVGTVTCLVSFDPNNDWAHRFVPVDPQVIADQIEAATGTHDLDVVLQADQGAQGLPEPGVVIGQQHSYSIDHDIRLLSGNTHRLLPCERRRAPTNSSVGICSLAA